MKKRGYFIHGIDEQCGFAVVATTLKEARQIVFKAGELDEPWIDIRGYWCRNAEVTDLPIGIISNLHTGLVRGLYGYIEDFKCDICGEKAAIVHNCKGQAMCTTCEEDHENV